MEQTGRRKERDRKKTGDKQATGRRHEKRWIRKKGAFDRQE
jgi:hypothetical protein